MAELILDSVTKRYGPITAVADVNFDIADGEFFTLVGPSGCGKSTTLSMIAGLNDPSEGTIRLGAEQFVDTAQGLNIPTERRNLGMVFQSYALWPHMSVAQNLAVPLKLRRIGRRERARRIEEALHQVGLEGMAARYPHELSGGQQQRVALARALVYRPRLLLLDEPLSNLDAKLRDRARAWLKQLQREVGITTIYVTHDQVEALSLSDRIAVLDMGRVAQVGTPHEIYAHPADPGVAAFVGRMNFLPGRVQALRGGLAEVMLEAAPGPLHIPVQDPDLSPGQKVTVAIRSEKLELVAPGAPAPAGEQLSLTLRGKAYVGARFEYELGLGDQVLHAESEANLPGPQVDVILPAEACLLFPAP
ncbi:ATP-binding cassette domain-containing protein [Pseudooceanicola sp. GBMRC 2024]|uniref:ATP-binding cassette domain-containing protein n=1 Tax=Pseudooceanicola albus TaxID=2692189 RepID=A0A6L7G2K4_9RHOB|nr:ABC transporter ATP-binding protein [Pseudooceanicola albus]MXN17932.1 ATP-binding cassette domain-containing protein [Pseudooceanicola albus]